MPKRFATLLICLLFLCGAAARAQNSAGYQVPKVYFSDSSRLGRPFAKDPSVIRFGGRYLMYYSEPPLLGATASHGEESGWGVGIAESRDLQHWSRIGSVASTQAVAQRGIAAPGARVIGTQVHLFYQTYGEGSQDAICHATSSDGVHFVEDAGNPVYRPTQMPWSVGRAIDAEVYVDAPHGKAYLFFATRDPTMKVQMLGLAEANLDSGLGAGAWHDVSTAGPILRPELPWEGECIEAPTVVRHGSRFYLFYGGAYNNSPQQIGAAVSDDLVHWTRLFDHPFVPNGPPGSWNSSESGHPGVLQAGGKTYLFYQGNPDHGHTYHISMLRVRWRHGVPVIRAQ